MFLRNEPKKSDVIIGLGSNDTDVADDVAYLYFAGIAPKVVFSGNVGRLTHGVFVSSEAQAMRLRALELGVPDEAILVEDASTNTGENIRLTQVLLEAEKIDVEKVVLVHKPYMLRRDYATFMSQWHGANTAHVACWARDVTFQAYLQNDSLPPGQTIDVMVGDLDRVLRYPAAGFQIYQHVPQSVITAFDMLVSRGYDGHLL